MIPIHVQPRGRLGNVMFQYAFARRLQELVPGAELVGITIPEFGIEHPDITLPENTLTATGMHTLDMLEIAHRLNTGVYDAVSLSAYVLKLQYLPSRHEAARMFPSLAGPPALIGANDLVINVRGAEVLGDVHQDYGPIPADFFEQVATASGREPVLVGQLGDDAYSDELRRRFAGCRIIESHSPISDFELVRSARHVVHGVSTFSWMAAWLSSTAETIHLPVSGLFNPMQRSDVDLLPFADERYHFYEFPIQEWHATPAQLHDLTGTGKVFRRLTRYEVHEMRRHADAREQRERAIGGFDLIAMRRQRDKFARELKHTRRELKELRAASRTSRLRRWLSWGRRGVRAFLGRG